MAQQLNETNYYEKLYTNIKLEMSYYVTQSGLSDDILNNIFDKELLRKCWITSTTIKIIQLIKLVLKKI